MTATKIKTATFKHIEAELYAYPDTKKEIARLREEILHGKANDDENIGGGRSNIPGRPTERVATRLVMSKRLRNLEEVAEAIDRVYERLPEGHQKLVKLRYWGKYRRPTWDDIAGKLFISKRQAMRWRDEIVHLIADQLGWR
ncbi:transcriptional regulator [Caldibacillus debilis]|uniref:Phage transcriptional activator, RinA family n=1 Tax=Caldibacillus debilis GB1 TaxID=1339248 RepID=A0A420VI17_9BACI|nr:transcriptional regulator [Caldibacillus debilis]RKO63245.1 phage transcriptional activator, RinA family [Caldibacillus debilis GB1]